MNVGTLGSIINLTICFAIPLMLVALGGMYSERPASSTWHWKAS